MRSRNNWLGAAALGLVGLAAQAAGPAAVAQDAPGGDVFGDVAWRTDLDAARGEARAAGKPMLVVFR